MLSRQFINVLTTATWRIQFLKQKNFPKVAFLNISRRGRMVLKLIFYIYIVLRLRWSRGSVLAFGTQVRGFKPGRSRRILKGEIILSTPFFGGEVKPSVPCRRFAACKRSLQLRASRIVDEIVGIFLAHEEFHLTLLGVSRVVGREGT
jgi:hypothetical protein